MMSLFRSKVHRKVCFIQVANAVQTIVYESSQQLYKSQQPYSKNP